LHRKTGDVKTTKITSSIFEPNAVRHALSEANLESP
jgi:hypothetical protein